MGQMDLGRPYREGNGAGVEDFREVLECAETVVIGAGAGLSASAGFTYNGERFRRYFADFETKYGFHDMYTGGFYPYQTPEEFWAYWSRYIMLNRYQSAPLPVYERFLRLVAGKDYFVITTNVDHCFQKAGFEKVRLFYTQGDYGLFQCARPCRQETYDNEETVRRMAAQQRDMRVPAELLPKCPVCGGPVVMNLRSDDRFVEDAGWREAAARYSDFLRRCQDRRVLFLELGVGGNTPGIIKYPFWQMTARNPRATYVCINDGEAACPKELEGQSLCINSDIGAVLETLENQAGGSKWNV